MYRSTVRSVFDWMFASVSSQAGVWKIASGACVDEGSGRLLRIACTSESVKPGKAESTALGAVRTLTRPGSSPSVCVVTLSYSVGKFWRIDDTSLSGLG